MARKKSTKKWIPNKSKWVDEIVQDDISKKFLFDVAENEKGNFKIINNNLTPTHKDVIEKEEEDLTMYGVGMGFPSHGVFYD
jgi:hypothetical protein